MSECSECGVMPCKNPKRVLDDCCSCSGEVCGDPNCPAIELICCEVCGRYDNEEILLLCDGNYLILHKITMLLNDSSAGCDHACHLDCLTPELEFIPDAWFCKRCESFASREDTVSQFRMGSNLQDSNRNGMDLSNWGKSCNCKKSRCLKQYCDCFREHQLCTISCRCSGCLNTSIDRCELGIRPAGGLSTPWSADLGLTTPSPAILTDAQLIQAAADKTAAGSPLRPRMERVCRCKRSRCLKRYCECYQNDQQCTPKCSCSDCGNGLAHDDPRAATDAQMDSDDAVGSGPDSPRAAAPPRPVAPSETLEAVPFPIAVAATQRHKISTDGPVRHDRPLLPHGASFPFAASL